MEDVVDFGEEEYVDNKADLDAINEYVLRVQNRIANGEIKLNMFANRKWEALRDDWKPWYDRIIHSWYVSDEDAAFARKKRDDIKHVVEDPEAVKFVERTSVGKKTAATPEDYQKIVEDDQSFFRKHWKAVAVGATVAVGAVYIGAWKAVAGILVKKLV